MTLVTLEVVFAAPTPQIYEQIVMKFIISVTVAMESSIIVGQSLVGEAHGCTSPAMTLFFVRKYLASEKESVPTMKALRIREATRESRRRMRMRRL